MVLERLQLKADGAIRYMQFPNSTRAAQMRSRAGEKSACVTGSKERAKRQEWAHWMPGVTCSSPLFFQLRLGRIPQRDQRMLEELEISLAEGRSWFFILLYVVHWSL
jgi:hypothetical protein